MLFGIFITILIMAGIVMLGKIIAMMLPDIVRVIIGVILGIGGPIYFFISWHWIAALLVTIPWLIVCWLFIEGSDID